MVERFISRLETAPISISSWLLAFAGVVWIRYFLEAFSSPGGNGYLPSDIPTLTHYTLFYLATTLACVWIISATAGIALAPILRIVIHVLPIIWLAPLIDLARGGAAMGYLYAATGSDFFRQFLMYFGPYTGTGMTLGLRIEIGILLVIIGMYVYSRTKHFGRALLAVLLAYAAIFVLCSLPSVLALFLPNGTSLLQAIQDSLLAKSFLHPSEMYAPHRLFDLLFDAAMAQLLFVILCISASACLLRARKDVARAFVGNLRPNRMAHYLVFAGIGGITALVQGAQLAGTIIDFITIAVAVLTIALAFMFAVITNDLVDVSIDTVSNTDRPLVAGTISRQLMKGVGLAVGLLMLLGALTLGSYATYWILVFSAAYYIYSVPPLRLRRIPILASAFIGVATLASLLFGFFSVSADRSISAVPVPLVLIVFLFVTLVANVRDLKDIDGDSAAGIWTLPTLLGDHRSRFVIGGLVFLACVLVPVFCPIAGLWGLSLVFGILAWRGLMLGAGERFLFPLYFVYLMGVAFLWYLT